MEKVWNFPSFSVSHQHQRAAFPHPHRRASAPWHLIKRVKLLRVFRRFSFYFVRPNVVKGSAHCRMGRHTSTRLSVTFSVFPNFLSRFQDIFPPSTYPLLTIMTSVCRRGRKKSIFACFEGTSFCHAMSVNLTLINNGPRRGGRRRGINDIIAQRSQPITSDITAARRRVTFWAELSSFVIYIRNL